MIIDYIRMIVWGLFSLLATGVGLALFNLDLYTLGSLQFIIAIGGGVIIELINLQITIEKQVKEKTKPKN